MRLIKRKNGKMRERERGGEGLYTFISPQVC